MKFEDFKKLIDRYSETGAFDEKGLLRNNPSLDNLYAFANLREGIVEWIDFKPGATILQAGADEGSLTGLYLRKGLDVTVYETDDEETEKLRYRYPGIKITDKPEGQFDYLAVIGCDNGAELAMRFYPLVKDGGELIFACDNKYGVAAWTESTGGKMLTSAYGRTYVEKLIDGLGEGEKRFYYPVWDMTFPNLIFSDERLPEKGELTHRGIYYDSSISLADVNKKFDEIIEDGKFADFANSLLVRKKKNAAFAGKQPVYVKYNRTRKDEYKIKTVIYMDENGRRTVSKEALYKEGAAHIRSFADKKKLLDSEGRNIRYLEARISDDGMRAEFDYIEGEHPDNVEFLFDGKPIHNIDCIPDNFIISDGAVIGIDYEWTDDEPVDEEYIRWRLSPDYDNVKYKMLEDDFQRKIHGDVQAVYYDNYLVDVHPFDGDAKTDFLNTEGLKAQLNYNNKEISRMTEVKRLTDNHVANLEIMLRDKDAEISNMREALDYFGRHEALHSKLRRKAGESFNKKYPKGSDERKAFMYKLHPLSTMRLKATEEGRNIIDGDFTIGDIYKERGKLVFDTPENPEVSIVLPCYNQIAYTYRCLASILKYTADVSYEVIIADDNSSDATSRLSDFASGLVICRSEENKGFLRNCNAAAAKARGEYIMFLNNDTEVTKGWLSSLTKLLKEDSSIGMTGSKLVFPDGRLQEAGGIIWSDGSGWNYGRGDDPDKFEYNYVRDVDYISGAAILIRKNLWEEIGGFDERYVPAYCEDSDLAFEVRKHGFRVTYQPLSEVIHYEGISNGTDVHGEGQKKYQLINAGKLKEKWAEELKQQFENTGNPDPFRARERSRDRKMILVIDHYVPEFDKDAGSKTTYQYLKLFLAKGYEVKFIGADFEHEEPYTTALEQMGIEVVYGDHMKAQVWDWLEKHLHEFELVYLNRPHIAAEYIGFLKNRNAKVLYYGHDLHYLRTERQFRLTGDAEAREESIYWKSVETGILRKADMNYYPSQEEIDAVHELDKSIRAKAIIPYVYDEFPQADSDFEKREGILFVGGFAHPPNKDGLKWFIDNIWEDVYAKTGTRLIVVGSNADEEVKTMTSKPGVVLKGRVSDSELISLYGSCRISAVPLRYGAGVKGKVVEAIHYGCPVITTDVGAEGIPDAEDVLVIENEPEAFAARLAALYKDTGRLAQMSAKSAEHSRKHNSMDAAWNIIKGDFL